MTKNPKLILWDLDGVLCPHNDAFFHLAPIAVASAAIELGIPLSVPQAEEYARLSFTGQRACVQAFAARFPLNEEELFARYYCHLSTDFLSPSAGPRQAFAQKAGLIHGVLTHAPESWAHRALSKLGLLDLFASDFIWGRGNLDGYHKTDAMGRDAIVHKLRRKKMAPSQVALVDDKIPVLETLKDCADTRIWINPDIRSQVNPPTGIHSAADVVAALSLIS